jgi:uncharacterized protein (TIGR02246 family)
MRTRSLALAAALFAISVRVAFAGDYSELHKQVTAANDRYAVAAIHRDAATIAADYEPDGIFANSTGLVLKGRAAIRNYYAQRLAHATIVSVHCGTQTLKSDGTMAWEYGSCRITARTKNGLVTRTGMYLTVWHKDADGKWRIAANMA